MIAVLLAAAALLAAATSPPAASASPAPSSSPAASSAPVPTPHRTLPPNAHVWQGITPGKPATLAHAKFGMALLVRLLPDGSMIDWYPGPTTNAYVIISERNNIVQYVRAFPLDVAGPLDGLKDPYGVSPGFDYEEIKSLRGEANQARQIGPGAVVVVYQDDQGFVWLYDLTSSGVHGIALYDTHVPKADIGAPVVSDPHDGASIGRAYVIHAHNEAEGVRFERYYATHRGGCSLWTITNQTLLSLGSHSIDQLDLECEDNKDQASMFFDVTSFVGKT